ncbi:Alpha/Beta hydrolase protein [Cantharellus anzutake]|uniref:Alpha/Beta hydrolase protein n=1 Tax=Cantharellus anzutake TaxID=1750568 RepID=UPI001907B6BF|nr:Alpha/Beta hydrolase protein [Cantharellus anzutake]KAF8323587.1 Alpha/Beta hydrolase protein [Cantharellus anzutake]
MSSPSTNPTTANNPVHDDEPLPTDGDDDIHSILRKLRLDEVVGLSQNNTHKRTVRYNAAGNYISLVFLETGRYIRYLFQTWTSVIISILFGGLGLFDALSLLFFAVGGSALLLLILIFCLAAHFPVLVRLYYRWSAKYGGGLGLVNAGNPSLFYALTQEQAAAAKKALGVDIAKQKDNTKERFFDFDIAKLTLQIASVIYEHDNDAIRKAVALTASDKPKTYAPQLSSIVSGIRTNLDPPSHGPGRLLEDLFGEQKSDDVSQALDSEGDRKIREFCAKFGIDFEPVSELNNTSSAFAGLFWDPNSNWIILSFKGTGPIEFGEWLSDFNAFMVPVGTHVNLFSKVHKGFKERVFPEDVSKLGSFRPYDTILAGTKALAKWLRKKNGFGDNVKINLWFTGHSLGCATASLVYTRMVMNDDLPKKIELRNPYLFAAPILCDRPSVESFNGKMFGDSKRIKTMWRITSNDDAVATLLPELGDYNSLQISPNNGFAFAHLGTELKLRNEPDNSNVAGNHITYGTTVHLDSAFSKEEIAKQRAEHLAQPGEAKRELIGVFLQKIPLIGRLIAHCTIYYWDQLDRVAIGECNWVIN